MNNVTIHILVFLGIISTGLKAQTVKDIDGNIYTTINKDSNTWMAENLKTTRYNDGTSIPLIEDSKIWESLTQPAYCWLYNDEKKYKEMGALYNWYAVETGKLCPEGWHVPTDKIFLIEVPWPGGYRHSTGQFIFSGESISHWTSTEESIETAYDIQVPYNSSTANRYYSLKNTGLFVRCVKNNDQE